ncbi:unnamed protein product, partial [Didymodactylos carnosus]
GFLFEQNQNQCKLVQDNQCSTSWAVAAHNCLQRQAYLGASDRDMFYTIAHKINDENGKNMKDRLRRQQFRPSNDSLSLSRASSICAISRKSGEERINCCVNTITTGCVSYVCIKSDCDTDSCKSVMAHQNAIVKNCNGVQISAVKAQAPFIIIMPIIFTTTLILIITILIV